MKLIERLIEEGGSDSSSRNFASPNISENVVRLVGRHFPSYVESDCTKKNIAKMCGDSHVTGAIVLLSPADKCLSSGDCTNGQGNDLDIKRGLGIKESTVLLVMTWMSDYFGLRLSIFLFVSRYHNMYRLVSYSIPIQHISSTDIR
ncbi:hypothetical protein TNCV_2149651 [Trichonephila clavipes]|nr:hypothetical protein TNCV_2149651 [Trichonephila clavipes]